MNMDIINDLVNNLKENKFVQNFIKDLSNYLNNNIKSKRDEIPIINDILEKNNFTTGNKNTIRWNLKKSILSYAERNSIDEKIYFIKDSKDNDNYKILMAEKGKIEEIEVNKNDVPTEAKINDVLKMKDNNYVIDYNATKELQEDINNMAKEILNKQNINLEKHRKEGHLYMVTEELGNNRFLLDLSDTSKVEFEEVDIPKDLLEVATEGMVLKYTNGKYEYYSDDGFLV